MQIGIRLHDTVNLPLDQRIVEVKKQGFTCTHLALSKVIQEFSVKADALTPGLAMHIKRLFDMQQIDIAVLGCYLNLAHPDKEEIDKILSTYKAHIRFASILGAGVVGTETGAPNKKYEYEPACRTEKALQTFVHNLKTVVDYAEKSGVILAIEPVLNHIVYDARRARKVLDEIKSPNLQIIFDPVNLIGLENINRKDEVIEEAIDLLGNEIAVIHMKDYVVEDNKMIPVAAGFGEMNYQSIMKFMKKRKPYIHVTLENTKPENAVIAKKTLDDLWAQV